jgi:hypothetical protein
MSSHRERVLRGNVSSEHLVQLFDESQSLIEGVAAFLDEGWKRGDCLPVGQATSNGRLVVLDAGTTLATFMVNGDPQPEKFLENVGEVVARLCTASEGRLSIYGEMVDVLVEQGNFVGAEQLEALWNGLGERWSFRLLCGYCAAHFGDERTARHLHAICNAHHSATARATDLLATWLLSNRQSTFHTDPP